MPRGNSSLDNAVFAPNSIGLIGLSSNPNIPAGRVLGFLRANHCPARIIVVNPYRETVQGERTYPSISACSAPPEHAYVLVGHDRVEAAVRDCAEAGVHVCTVLADGYAEAGEEGAAKQARLVDIAKSAGMRLLGPNSMGLADLHSGTLMTVNAIYNEPDTIRGPVSLISQSGSIMGAVISRAKALGLGFSRIAAVGNEADLGVAELGRIMLDDPHCKVLLLFLETIRDADGLARMAAKAHEMGKAVVAYKLGRSDVGAQMAVAHTGALLAEDSVVDAYLRDVGIARVTTLEGLVEAPMLFSDRKPPERSPRVGTLTTTGGGGAMVCDRLALEGANLQPPSDATLKTIRDLGIDVVAGPVLDLTMAGAGPEFVKPAVEAMARDPEVDLILSVTGSSGRSSPERTVPPLAEADTAGKPIACFITPDAPESLSGLIGTGLPVFRTPESAADVIAAYCRWRAPRMTGLARMPSGKAIKFLDEAASLQMLKEAGLPVSMATSFKIGETPDLSYPVVLKVLSDQVPHKTEAGGVVLNIGSSGELALAAEQIRTRVEKHHPDIAVTDLLAAPMLSPLQEVLIGYRLDPQVGPVITLAPGGISVGLYDDKAIRLAPVDQPTARAMIDEVTGLAPVRGHRGLPHGDLDALAAAIMSLSRLADHQPAVLEAEANPVMVMADGVVAADALVTLAAEDS
ncbi:MAG: acetate--CoA ligase family protein [Pseudomonadota bacterium]